MKRDEPVCLGLMLFGFGVSSLVNAMYEEKTNGRYLEGKNGEVRVAEEKVLWHPTTTGSP